MTGKLTALSTAACLALTLSQCLNVQAAATENPMDTFGPQRSMVTGETTAYVVMPAVIVSGTSVDRAHWSPDGSCIALVRTSLKTSALQDIMRAQMGGAPEAPTPSDVDLGDTELLVYTRDGKLTPVWRARIGMGEMSQLYWLAPNTLVAVVQDRSEDAAGARCLVVRVARSKPQITTLPAGQSGCSVDISPSAEAALIVCDGIVHLVRSTGVAASVSLGQERAPVGIGWSADGSQPYLSRAGEDGKRSWFGISDLSLTPLSAEPEMFRGSAEAAPSRRAPLRLAERPCSASEGKVSASLKTLWLEAAGDKSKQTPCLVSGDTAAGELSPNCDAVLYITADGAAFVRNIVPVDKARPTALREQALRTRTVAQTKQIGLAVLMYSTDHDDQLPQPSDFATSLTDYARGLPAGTLDNFQFTYAGTSLSSIDQPSTTILGYLPGPGGFAALYADSHVEWKTTVQK